MFTEPGISDWLGQHSLRVLDSASSFASGDPAKLCRQKSRFTTKITATMIVQYFAKKRADRANQREYDEDV